MNLVLLTSTMSPAVGGPAYSVPKLANNLEEISTGRVQVVGVEDPNDTAASAQWASNVFAHRPFGLRAFGYGFGVQRTLSRLAPDIIDVQGLWQFHSLANLRHHIRFRTPYVVTPRGMLDPWGLERSKWKKYAVRLWFEDSHLARATCLRATAEMEAEQFRRFGLQNPIAIVPNGVDVPGLLPARPERERMRMLFISRIHPKKGIELLLKAWAAIEVARPNWELVIAGPDESGHTIEMQHLARKLSLRRVDWRSAVYGNAKSTLYRSADCLVLPTHAENFGLVVAEALAHEVPVVTTKNAPWEGLLRNKCGWWIDLEETQLRDALLEATAQPSSALRAMGARGRNWMSRDYSWSSVARQMFDVYNWSSGRGPRPETIHTA
jgi:glycosyltransferase involved in cell wall biosynthesis